MAKNHRVVGLVAALSSQTRRNICKEALNCLTANRKCAWNRPCFSSFMRRWDFPSVFLLKTFSSIRLSVTHSFRCQCENFLTSNHFAFLCLFSFFSPCCIRCVEAFKSLRAVRGISNKLYPLSQAQQWIKLIALILMALILLIPQRLMLPLTKWALD